MAAAAPAVAGARWRTLALRYGPVALLAAVLAARTIAAIVARVGHPGAALDDAYIHFQYARALVEGHPMRFHAGDPPSSGATSLLWPVVLAPFWAVGFRGEAILWPCWALSFAALGGLAWEAARLTERLAGKAAAVGAGAMVLACSGLVWFAASGMEVLPFAWAIARATRRSAEWHEREAERTPRRLRELVALAWASALLRPEGAIAALFVTATLARRPPGAGWRGRAWALLAAAGVAASPALLWLATGSARSTTAAVKLLPGNPYFTGAALVERVVFQLRQLVTVLLQGEQWSAEFFPHGAAPLWLAGLGAIAVLGWQRKARWRAAGVLALALTIAAPCAYYTFLWNRLRYLWPFVPGWLVGLACLARVAGDLLAAWRPRWRLVTPLFCGACAGALAVKVEGAIDDVAWSASGIDRQQVALGRWAAGGLPPGARVGVNDTGAIAYFGEHETFDVVGLTTASEGRYWVAGAGSRLEHYERMPRERLPTHFIVYPEWMGLPMLLGETLHEATVSDSGRSILGGETMTACEADWSELGTGERPWSAPGAAILDAVDVADLESEAEHGYALLDAVENEQVAREAPAPSGDVVLDAGRTRRTLDRFFARLPPGRDARAIVRLEAPAGASHVELWVEGQPAGSVNLGLDPGWIEASFLVPSTAAGAHTRVELRATGATVTTFHYWFVAP